MKGRRGETCVSFLDCIDIGPWYHTLTEAYVLFEECFQLNHATRGWCSIDAIVLMTLKGMQLDVLTSLIGIRACKSRARNRGWGSWGWRSIYSMLTYRTLFCFGRNNRTVPK